MITSTARTALISSQRDAALTVPLAPLRKNLSFFRPDPVADSASGWKMYDVKNPAHALLEKRNEQLAMSTGPLLRALKDATGLRGACNFVFDGVDGQRASMFGTAKGHMVFFDETLKDYAWISKGELSNHGKNVTPMTLNRNLSLLVAALSAPDAAQFLSKEA
ncbi:hypothetical protein ACSFA3_13795 [Variovorax sp. RHLX14]|uniref:hypothetical protein n=1 Tax=Variovorax sp. RHLX14 TaxID=1259731 RepID=UPI003F4790CE